MNGLREFKPVSKSEFEEYLRNNHNFIKLPPAFYDYEWKWIQNKPILVKRKHSVKEHMYLIRLSSNYGILVYSGILTADNTSRKIGSDAIRTVPVYIDQENRIRTLKAVPIVKRLPRWKENLDKRLLEEIEWFGNSIKCPECNGSRLLKRNSSDKGYFLGCSNYPKCYSHASLHFKN